MSPWWICVFALDRHVKFLAVNKNMALVFYSFTESYARTFLVLRTKIVALDSRA